jgi:hypothetical protein
MQPSENGQPPEISVPVAPALSVYNMQAAEYNPREISDADFKGLKNSIKTFGDLSGIVRNTQTGNLVGGHQRIEAFKQLENPQVIIEETLPAPNSVGTTARGYVLLGDEKYTYREVDWTLQKEMQANLAANRLQGKFTQDKLAKVMADIEEELRADTGFTQKQIDKLLSEIDKPAGESEALLSSAAFIIPPLSVLDTTAGYWQERGRAWHKLAGTTPQDGGLDPVIIETVLRWFSPGPGIVKLANPLKLAVAVAQKMGYTVAENVPAETAFVWLPSIDPGQFSNALEQIRGAFNELKTNRFLVVYTAEQRLPNGGIRGNITELVAQVTALGTLYYNDIIVSRGSTAKTAAGIAPGRRVNNSHENLLVFFKGDPATIEQDFGIMKADMPDGLQPANWQVQKPAGA